MENTKLSFKVQSFRKLPNPYQKQSDVVSESATMFVAICDVKDIPEKIPMETNPREQNMKTGVAKKIKQTLLDTNSANFYLLNRGLLLSAKNASFNNYSNEITIEFDDPEVHGNVDGGHTYRTILENRDQLEIGQQYVKLEILTGAEGFFQSLAAARNTSVPVQDKSIAELEDRFEIIKKALHSEPYYSRLFFKENDDGDIDVSDILAVLNLFNLDRYPNIESFPTISYSGKKKCIDYYIDEHKAHENSPQNPYIKMSSIMPDFFKLYDKIESSMAKFYKQKFPNGRYGAIKGVILPKGVQGLKTKFFETSMECGSPNGFIYPILGAFRALLVNENGYYEWKKNPFAILEKVGKDLVEVTVERSRSLGNNPQSTGKDIGNWKTLYMTIMFEIMTE